MACAASMTRNMARPTTTSSRPAARAALATEPMRATLEAKVVTATRCGASRMRRASVTATSASDGETPSRTALVESQISAASPSSPSAFSADGVGRRAGQRVLVELPIAGMQRRAERRADHHRGRLGDRMRHVDQLDVERADRAAAAERHDMQREAVDEAHLGELRFQHLGGEGRGIDRDAGELRPEIDHRAEMILMRVGQQQADDIVPLLLDEADVGKDDVDAGLGLAAEGHAHVDDEPFARAARGP